MKIPPTQKKNILLSPWKHLHSQFVAKRYGMFSGWEMAARRMEVLLVVSGFDVDRLEA
jgi:hypothetical protein